MPAHVRPCVICGAMIEPERVELAPHTRLCLEHAKMMDKYGGEFRITAMAKSSANQGCSDPPRAIREAMLNTRNVEGLAKLREEYERGR